MMVEYTKNIVIPFFSFFRLKNAIHSRNKEKIGRILRNLLYDKVSYSHILKIQRGEYKIFVTDRIIVEIKYSIKQKDVIIRFVLLCDKKKILRRLIQIVVFLLFFFLFSLIFFDVSSIHV